MFEDAEARSLFATLLKKCDDAVDLTTKVYFVDFDSNKQSAKRMRKSRWAVNVNEGEKLGISPSNKLTVLEVAENGPFGHTGLQKGDVITSINGKEFCSAKAAVKFINEARAGKKSCVIILNTK